MHALRLKIIPGLTSIAAQHDDLALGQRHGRQRTYRLSLPTAQGGIVAALARLPLIGIDDHDIDEHAENLDQLRIQRPALGDMVHLSDHDPPAVVAAWAMAWASRNATSSSNVMLPSSSAVVPRTMPTSTCHGR